MNCAVAVPEATVTVAVDAVFPIVMEQLPVLSEALMFTSVKTCCDAVPVTNVRCTVCVTNTAVGACSTGTTSHQFVPSFPTRQSSFTYPDSEIGHDRLTTFAVTAGACLKRYRFRAANRPRTRKRSGPDLLRDSLKPVSKDQRRYACRRELGRTNNASNPLGRFPA